ncbi:MAG TPA: hypothetical protein VKA60_09530 [Blastocatellia bacterium]|nr:hypothetical protein [Blastocatellia bacterium]
MPATKPQSMTLRTYQVGFGDCFLLTFHYAKRDRHVLIDFGSTGQPKTAPADLMLQVANNIKERCGGKLDAVVATHRHKDHISGFTTSKGKGSGDIIASCEPTVVIQPWTEDPDAQPDATQATHVSSGAKAFVSSLHSMHAVSESLLLEIQRLRGGISRTAFNQLAFLGEDNLTNRSAVENLMTMGKHHYYVNAGSKSGLATILPGVKTYVLGPPTVKQSQAITKMRSKDPDEFWHLLGLAGQSLKRGNGQLFPKAETYAAPPAQTRWLIHRMQALRGDQMLELVRALDTVMNNTSVILLFQVGDKKFLFPGDAQLENWAYALSQEKNRKLLADVHLYKVGHHGSLNATPKSLWGLFTNRAPLQSAKRLNCVVSTMAGKHGTPSKGTEVPRSKLVEELKKMSNYFTTQDLKGKNLFKDFTFDLT